MTTTAPPAPATDVHAPRRARASVGPKLIPALLLLPVFALLVLSFAWPLATIVVRSLNSEGMLQLSNVTFEHYQSLFADDLLRQITIETLRLAVVSTFITVLLAFPTAFLMSRLSRRSALVLLVLVTTPLLISILVRLFAFTTILGREGLINSAAESVGMGPYDLLFNTAATVVGMVAYLLPYMILVLYAGMNNLDGSLMTAAKTMGATPRQAFLQIYLPQVRPAFVSGATLIFVLSLGFFLTPAILGGPTNMTLPVYIQQQITIFDWGGASAAGVALLIASLVGYAVALKIGGSGVLGSGGRTLGRGVVGQERLRLSAWTVLAWLATAIVLAILLLPMIVIFPAAFGTSSQLTFPPVGYTTDWFTSVLSDPLWTRAFAKSLRVGLGTAVVSVAVAMILARTATTASRKSVRTAISVVAFAPLVVPVVLLGIGVYDVQTRLNLVGTDIGLILAHSVIAFPLAFIVINNAFSNLDSSLEAAAWSMGTSRLRTFWTIVVPNLVPALVGALLISFITSWDEPVLALFQTGLEKTLPVTIFSLINSGVTPAVGAVAVMLMTPVLVVAAVILVIGRRRTSAQPKG